MCGCLLWTFLRHTKGESESEHEVCICVSFYTQGLKDESKSYKL